MDGRQHGIDAALAERIRRAVHDGVAPPEIETVLDENEMVSLDFAREMKVGMGDLRTMMGAAGTSDAPGEQTRGG